MTDAKTNSEKSRDQKKLCSFEGCEKPHSSRGFCSGHAHQWRKGKKLTPLRRWVKREGCEFPGCEKPHKCLRLCVGHYSQIRKRQELTPLFVMREGCEFPGCEKPHRAQGLCQAHYRQKMGGKDLTPLQVSSHEIGRIRREGLISLLESLRPQVHNLTESELYDILMQGGQMSAMRRALGGASPLEVIRDIRENEAQDIIEGIEDTTEEDLDDGMPEEAADYEELQETFTEAQELPSIQDLGKYLRQRPPP